MTTTNKTHAGRVAVITGAVGGLGVYFTEALARAGCGIAIADLAPAEELVASIEAMGQRAYSEICDLADADQVHRFALRTLEHFGKVDILVNNAAYMPIVPFDDLTIEHFRRFEAINVEASLLLAQAFAPGMRERRYGRIVQIASSTTGTPMPGFLAYVTTKMAGIGLVRALAAEFGNNGIRVNALSPGLTKTPASEKNLPPELFDAVRNLQLIKQTEVPEDLVGALLFLTSEQCGFITGQTIHCDGGVQF